MSAKKKKKRSKNPHRDIGDKRGACFHTLLEIRIMEFEELNTDAIDALMDQGANADFSRRMSWHGGHCAGLAQDSEGEEEEVVVVEEEVTNDEEL